MIIFFLRHGETEATKAGEIQGGANGERNSVTKEGLEKAVAFLKDVLITEDPGAAYWI